jgi:3-isopropylmalate dehydrogenase
VRELTGGIYFGDRKEDDGDGTAYDIEPYSRPEIERVTRLAAQLALAEDPPAPVWSLDKANVLATSRLWRNVFTQVMEKEYPQLKFGHHLIDSAAMLMVKNPRALNGIIVTSNLFGDIISDEASVIPGSLGLLPSASLSGIPDGKSRVSGIYEPIHGMYSLKLFRKPSMLIVISFRLGTRHRRSRYRQPSRHRSLYEHDVEILLLLARTCKEDRRGRQDHH